MTHESNSQYRDERAEQFKEHVYGFIGGVSMVGASVTAELAVDNNLIVDIASLGGILLGLAIATPHFIDARRILKGQS